MRANPRVIAALGAAIFLAGCGRTHARGTAAGSEATVARPSLDQVLRDHTAELMSIPGVLGTGEGAENGRPCVLVLVRRRTAEVARSVPDSLEGYPVVIREVGEVRAVPGRH